MFAKVASAALFLSLSLHASGHALIEPPIGITGTFARSDVTRPSTASPCDAGVNVASALAKSTVVQADATGAFTVNVQNFNAGADGSTSVTAKVDPTAVGTTFTDAVTIGTNGDADPTTVGTAKVSATLPPGTVCTGGANKATCLVQFTTTAGFGNCVAVTTSTAGAAPAAAAPAAAAPAAAAPAAADATTAKPAGAAKAGKKAGKKGGKKAGKVAPKGSNNAAAAGSSKKCSSEDDKRAVGTRAARPMRAVVEARRIEEGTLL